MNSRLDGYMGRPANERDLTHRAAEEFFAG